MRVFLFELCTEFILLDIREFQGFQAFTQFSCFNFFKDTPKLNLSKKYVQIIQQELLTKVINLYYLHVHEFESRQSSVKVSVNFYSSFLFDFPNATGHAADQSSNHFIKYLILYQRFLWLKSNDSNAKFEF